MIENALRVALRIFRGKIIFISRLSHSAECDNAIFTRGAAIVKGRSELQMQLTATPPPVKKAFQPSPQAWLKCKLKS
ncbi:hypothetical protein [Faecalibacterium sp. PGM34]